MENQDSINDIIKITPEFLFDSYKVFKSEFAPWIYLIFKIKFEWSLTLTSDKRFRIPSNGLCRLFGIDPSTVSRAIKELVNEGFLVKYNNLYKIEDETFYKVKYKPDEKDTVDKLRTNYPEFINVYDEGFGMMFLNFRERIPEKYNSAKFLLKLLETNYYLSATNHHCCLEVKKEMVASPECIHSICKALHCDNRTVKDILVVLEDVGYIKLDSDFKITTIDIYYEEDAESKAEL